MYRIVAFGWVLPAFSNIAIYANAYGLLVLGNNLNSPCIRDPAAASLPQLYTYQVYNYSGRVDTILGITALDYGSWRNLPDSQLPRFDRESVEQLKGLLHIDEEPRWHSGDPPHLQQRSLITVYEDDCMSTTGEEDRVDDQGDDSCETSSDIEVEEDLANKIMEQSRVEMWMRECEERMTDSLVLVERRGTNESLEDTDMMANTGFSSSVDDDYSMKQISGEVE